MAAQKEAPAQGGNRAGANALDKSTAGLKRKTSGHSVARAGVSSSPVHRRSAWHKALTPLRLEPVKSEPGNSARKRLWRVMLALSDGNQDAADRWMAREWPPAPDPKVPATDYWPRGKDWFAKHPRPNAQLVAWMRRTHVEFARALSACRKAACEHCGRPVQLKKHRRHVFCSGACARAYYNAQRARVVHAIQACAQCGKGFEPTRADAKFCSSACRQRAHRKTVSNIRDAAQEAA